MFVKPWVFFSLYKLHHFIQHYIKLYSETHLHKMFLHQCEQLSSTEAQSSEAVQSKVLILQHVCWGHWEITANESLNICWAFPTFVYRPRLMWLNRLGNHSDRTPRANHAGVHESHLTLLHTSFYSPVLCRFISVCCFFFISPFSGHFICLMNALTVS